jgi:hypothetical protein
MDASGRWQVKKSYRRRKLVRVTHVMRLGTKDALKAALQGLGLSGRLNTAFIERVNLTVRHGVAALARRTWATRNATGSVPQLWPQGQPSDGGQQGKSCVTLFHLSHALPCERALGEETLTKWQWSTG